MSEGCNRRAVLLLAVASLLSACDLAPEFQKPKEALSPEAIALRDAPPERVFKGVLAGQPMHLIAEDCEVFQITADPQGKMEWTRVLRTEPYPLAFCERQSLAATPLATGKGTAVTAVLGRRAFGSGGCCASGGTYRTTDGVTWKKL